MIHVVYEHNDADALTRVVKNDSGTYTVTCLDHATGETVAETRTDRADALRLAYLWAGQ